MGQSKVFFNELTLLVVVWLDLIEDIINSSLVAKLSDFHWKLWSLIQPGHLAFRFIPFHVDKVGVKPFFHVTTLQFTHINKYHSLLLTKWNFDWFTFFPFSYTSSLSILQSTVKLMEFLRAAIFSSNSYPYSSLNSWSLVLSGYQIQSDQMCPKEVRSEQTP